MSHYYRYLLFQSMSLPEFLQLADITLSYVASLSYCIAYGWSCTAICIVSEVAWQYTALLDQFNANGRPYHYITNPRPLYLVYWKWSGNTQFYLLKEIDYHMNEAFHRSVHDI